MPWSAVSWAFFAAAHMVNQEGAAVRSACDPDAPVVARAARGDAARILFSISGELGACYKVAVASDGREIQGYLPAAALSGLESFERARASASRVEVPAEVRRQFIQRSAAAAANSGGGPAAGSGDNPINRADQLIAAGRSEEALELLEKLVAAGRRDPNTLAFAGLAALQSDQPKAALDYFEQSLALAPDSTVEHLRDRARRELAGDRSSEKLVGIKFNFRYDDKAVTPDQARALLPVLDSEFTRISEELGCRSEERMTAIVQTEDAYRRSTGAAEWSGGQYDGRIRVALLEPSPGEHTRQTFAHEIVHACLARTGQWPSWLHEGLAQKLSGQQIPAAYRERVRQMARSGELPSLAEMGRSWSRLSSEHATLAYTTALLAAEHLYEAYGTSGIRSLLQNPSSLPRLTADIDQRLRE